MPWVSREYFEAEERVFSVEVVRVREEAREHRQGVLLAPLGAELLGELLDGQDGALPAEPRVPHGVDLVGQRVGQDLEHVLFFDELRAQLLLEVYHRLEHLHAVLPVLVARGLQEHRQDALDQR